MLYDSVCLNGPQGQLIQVLVSNCDDFEYCDVTVMTFESRDVIDDVDDVTIDALLALSYRVPIGHEPLNASFPRFHSIKVADTRTQSQTDTPTDNKGQLQLNSCTSQLNAYKF